MTRARPLPSGSTPRWRWWTGWPAPPRQPPPRARRWPGSGATFPTAPWPSWSRAWPNTISSPTYPNDRTTPDTRPPPASPPDRRGTAGGSRAAGGHRGGLSRRGRQPDPQRHLRQRGLPPAGPAGGHLRPPSQWLGEPGGGDRLDPRPDEGRRPGERARRAGDGAALGARRRVGRAGEAPRGPARHARPWQQRGDAQGGHHRARCWWWRRSRSCSAAPPTPRARSSCSTRRSPTTWRPGGSAPTVRRPRPGSARWPVSSARWRRPRSGARTPAPPTTPPSPGSPRRR